MKEILKGIAACGSLCAYVIIVGEIGQYIGAWEAHQKTIGAIIFAAMLFLAYCIGCIISSIQHGRKVERLIRELALANQEFDDFIKQIERSKK